MRINLKGITRIVIEFKNVVVKIPRFTFSWNHFLRGLIANMDERDTWRWNSGKFEKGRSHLLCPVLWCSWGGWILIMPKAETFTAEDWPELYGVIWEHREAFAGDDNYSNYGLYKGMIVKIDYADLNLYWGEDFKIC